MRIGGMEARVQKDEEAYMVEVDAVEVEKGSKDTHLRTQHPLPPLASNARSNGRPTRWTNRFGAPACAYPLVGARRYSLVDMMVLGWHEEGVRRCAGLDRGRTAYAAVKQVEAKGEEDSVHGCRSVGCAGGGAPNTNGMCPGCSGVGSNAETPRNCAAYLRNLRWVAACGTRSLSMSTYCVRSS
jgi:hypothetical protein